MTEVIEEIKEEVKRKMTDYQQANFWECFPSGGIKDWHLKAVAVNIVQPMQAEIKELKATIEKLNSKAK